VDEVTRNWSVTIFVATDVSFVFIGSEAKVWDMILGKLLTTAALTWHPKVQVTTHSVPSLHLNLYTPGVTGLLILSFIYFTHSTSH
jgi:hypothetical protein